MEEEGGSLRPALVFDIPHTYPDTTDSAALTGTTGAQQPCATARIFVGGDGQGAGGGQGAGKQGRDASGAPNAAHALQAAVEGRGGAEGGGSAAHPRGAGGTAAARQPVLPGSPQPRREERQGSRRGSAVQGAGGFSTPGSTRMGFGAKSVGLGPHDTEAVLDLALSHRLSAILGAVPVIATLLDVGSGCVMYQNDSSLR